MDYVCNSTAFIPVYGDITEQDVDALAVASSPSLCMGAGIALKIRDHGGTVIEDEAKQQGPCAIGDVIVTSCGSLQAKAVFHCVLVDENGVSRPEALHTCMKKTLQEAYSRGYRSLALPALGSAFPGLSPKISTEIIVEETRAAVLSGMAFERMLFVVCDPAPYRYYKKALKDQCSE